MTPKERADRVRQKKAAIQRKMAENGQEATMES